MRASVLDSAAAAIVQRIAGVATESAASISAAVVQLQMLQLLDSAHAGRIDLIQQPPTGVKPAFLTSFMLRLQC